MTRRVLGIQRTYSLPRACPDRPRTRDGKDPCDVSAALFEQDLARIVGGFTRFDCVGGWVDDGGSVHFDTNYCYIANAANEARARATDLAFEQAGERGHQVASFRAEGGGRGTISTLMTPDMAFGVVPLRRARQASL